MASPTQSGHTSEAPWLVLLYLSGTSSGQVTANTAILRALEEATKGEPLNATCLYQFSYTDRTVWGTILADGAEHVLHEGPPVDIAEPRFLTKFIDWALDRTRSPIEQRARVALFVKDDGTGWMPDSKVGRPAAPSNDPGVHPRGILFDGVRYMTVPGLRQAVASSRCHEVAIYGLDGCQMGTIEVAYELKDVAEIMIADDTTATKTGFAYDAFLPWLRGLQAPLDAAKVAAKVVELTNTRYKEEGATIVGVRLEGADGVADAIDGLAGALRALDPSQLASSLGVDAQDGTQVLTTILSGVTKLGTVATSVDAVVKALSGFYVSQPGGNGLTIFLPVLGSQFITLYGSLAFGQRFSLSNLKPTWSQFVAWLNETLLGVLSRSASGPVTPAGVAPTATRSLPSQ
ncbi:MAG TPA: clostripain-related cysteine peptidase [Polyangiaceae bacterium]|jgi:hypothetical protein